MADPSQRDPAEGSRKTTEHNLRKSKNLEQEAENPGGRPTRAAKASASAHAPERQGQQGSTTHKGH